MPKGYIFWALMILVAVFGGIWRWSPHPSGPWGFGIVLWCLLALLGWQVFGFIIK